MIGVNVVGIRASVIDAANGKAAQHVQGICQHADKRGTKPSVDSSAGSSKYNRVARNHRKCKAMPSQR